MYAQALVIVGIVLTVLGSLVFMVVPALTGFQLTPDAEVPAMLAFIAGTSDTLSGLAADPR